MHPCLKHARQLLSVGLAVADLVSDIVLAVNYGVQGHKWWCGLTWAFIVVPIVVGVVLVFKAFLDYRKGKPRDDSTWRLWKGAEICFESGPQMLLQLYIISLAESRGTAISLERSILTILLQVGSVVTSMLALSYGFVEWRQTSEEVNSEKKTEEKKGGAVKLTEEKSGQEMEMETFTSTLSESIPVNMETHPEEIKEDVELKEENKVEETESTSQWTWKDMVVDMVWNVLAITSRVITLSLFASYRLYWFWGLVGAQIAVTSPVIFWYAHRSGILRCNIFDVFASIFTACGFLFNIFAAGRISFRSYILYWTFIFVENTVMISLWYEWSSEFGFWYHDWAISYVICAYFLSLIIEGVHCYYYKLNSKSNICHWMFIS